MPRYMWINVCVLDLESREILQRGLLYDIP